MSGSNGDVARALVKSAIGHLHSYSMWYAVSLTKSPVDAKFEEEEEAKRAKDVRAGLAKEHGSRQAAVINFNFATSSHTLGRRE